MKMTHFKKKSRQEGFTYNFPTAAFKNKEITVLVKLGFVRPSSEHRE